MLHLVSKAPSKVVPMLMCIALPATGGLFGAKPVEKKADGTGLSFVIIYVFYVANFSCAD